MGTDSSGTALAPKMRLVTLGNALAEPMLWFALLTLIFHQDRADRLKMLLNRNCFGFECEEGLYAKKKTYLLFLTLSISVIKVVCSTCKLCLS